MLNASYLGNNRMKRLKDFKVTEQIPHPAVEFLFMQFGDDEATHRIVMHHARCVIRQHREELQKLVDK